jgi:transcriptional regulator with XRE-family HTH domain
MQQRFPKLVRGLNEHMRENSITQADVAQEAGVNQATVSRFLSKKKPPQRVTAASQKLCEYVRIKASAGGSQKYLPADAQSALELCLNRSEAHAVAASKILAALAELGWPEDEEVASG